MEKPIRYGVVGIGGMGANHAKKLRENKIENAILTAVADSNVEYKNKFDVFVMACRRHLNIINFIKRQTTGGAKGKVGGGGRSPSW